VKPLDSAVPGPGWAVGAEDVAVVTGGTGDGGGTAGLGGGAAVSEFGVVAAPGDDVSDDFTTEDFTTDDSTTDEFTTEALTGDVFAAADPPAEHAVRVAAAHNASSSPAPRTLPPWHRSRSTVWPAAGLGLAVCRAC